jgi:hypothetical protein
MRGWLATGVFVVALVACGDDDDNSTATTVAVTTESTTPDAKIDSTIESTVGETPSSANTTNDETAAKGALLQLSDFPSGWTEQPVKTTDENVKTQRKNAECIGSDRPRINDLGGASAETGDFTAPSQDAIRNAVSFAASEDEATAHMAALRGSTVADCFATVTGDAAKNADLANNAKITNVTVAPLNVTRVGDDVVAYQVTIEIKVNNGTVSQYLDLVAVRVGRAVTSLQFNSSLIAPSTEDLDHYTGLAAQRLAEALR